MGSTMKMVGSWLSVLVFVVLAAGCRTDVARCVICQMPIPDETRAVVRIDSRQPEAVCDARCPLTLQEQTQMPVELVRVTDFVTGESLDPADAFYVTGSDTTPDAHTKAVRATSSDSAFLHWHRCLPSVLAFGTRADAVQFQRAHGGTVLTLAELGFAGG